MNSGGYPHAKSRQHAPTRNEWVELFWISSKVLRLYVSTANSRSNLLTTSAVIFLVRPFLLWYMDSGWSLQLLPRNCMNRFSILCHFLTGHRYGALSFLAHLWRNYNQSGTFCHCRDWFRFEQSNVMSTFKWIIWQCGHTDLQGTKLQ